MLKTDCPHCGKEVNMSLEELASCGNQVVCPQCLHEFVPEGYELQEPRQKGQKPVEANVQSLPHVLFCHSCGEKLPAADLRFCPYCGTGLFSNRETQSTTTGPTADYSPASNRQAAARSEATVVERDVEQQDYRLHKVPLIRTFNRAASREEIMGTPTTRFLCFVAIAVLFAIFVWLIYLIIKEGIY